MCVSVESSSFRLVLSLVAAVALLPTCPARGADQPAAEQSCPNADGGPFEKLLDPRRYPSYDECQHDFDRAGQPQCTSRLAQPTFRKHYNAYYVGGGAALYGACPTNLRGQPRHQTEGTFGVDYDPPWSRVRLQWFHGTRYQEGEGRYEPDRRNNPFQRFFSGR